jgi:hypothetical protein
MHAIELDATLKLAKAELRSGKVPEAEAMYREVLEGDPKCAEAIHFLLGPKHNKGVTCDPTSARLFLASA